MHHGYLVGLFDVLGFEQALARIGLAELRVRYGALMDAVNWRRAQSAGSDLRTHGAYASDSILLWANRALPCDDFLDACNDLICHGLEVGLPLRGAVSMGEAVLEAHRNIFLGRPLVDAARLEGGQKFIGASVCKSFVEQAIPKRFLLRFDRHLKSRGTEEWGGFVLDWPRHWLRTRSVDVEEVIRTMNIDAEHAPYYENTLDLVAHSRHSAARN